MRCVVSLFETSRPPKPLAERLRPKTLDDVLGQEEAKRILSGYIDKGEMPSVIFWGPPGSGKTTLSRLIASLLGWEGQSLNAASISVKEIRDLADEAKQTWVQLERRTVLFIDEIHRLNKSRQDVLLPFVEAGTFILVGSTTESPFFALNQALRSRVQLIQLKPLPLDLLTAGLESATNKLEIQSESAALTWIAERVGGDLRLAYTILESALYIGDDDKQVRLDDVKICLSQTQFSGDRAGDNHYDLASAFQKSMRGSDADAAVYYLARFFETGEDPRFIARRLLVTASEDVGNADPMALPLANAAFDAVERLGMPECRIPLMQAAIYVAKAPKSREAVASLKKAADYLQTQQLVPIPAQLRQTNSPEVKDAKSRFKGDNFLPPQVNSESFVVSSMRGAGEPAKQADISVSDQLKNDVFTLIQKEAEGRDWFEVDLNEIAQAKGVPVGTIRSAVNQLVHDQRLAFRRSFSIPSQASS